MHSAEFKNCIEAALNSNSSLRKGSERKGEDRKKREVRDKTAFQTQENYCPREYIFIQKILISKTVKMRYSTLVTHIADKRTMTQCGRIQLFSIPKIKNHPVHTTQSWAGMAIHCSLYLL